MKINLIHMILYNTEQGCFDGLIIDDDGNEMDAVQSLDYMIMEYAKVRNGGTAQLVVVPTSLLPINPMQLQHQANEWADAATNGLQWLRNIKENISSVEEALLEMEAGVAHCRRAGKSK